MILNIYKPLGWTSYDVVRKMKSILHTKKVGHSGSLDPLAEGVLLIVTDKDTKKQNELMQMKKEYVFEMALGIVSETYDMEGPLTLVKSAEALLNNSSEILHPEFLSKLMQKYVGTVKQLVPSYSATRYKGRALYKYARSGKMENISIPEKEVVIYAIEILEITPKKEILIMGKSYFLPHIKAKVICGKGTYIRSLAHSLGQELQTGAVVTKLTRTKIGPFKVAESKSVSALAELAPNPIE
jgi:tRNA pseudouridine55 synthase